MMNFLYYEGKVAVILLVFYLFFRFLLEKETFHRFNRAVLVGTAALSFLLPVCVITIHRQVGMVPVVMAPEITGSTGNPALVKEGEPWWLTAVAILFWAGVAFVLVRVAVSIVSIMRIIRKSELVQEDDGCKVMVTKNIVDPFSWMGYIVLSRDDWEKKHSSILVHEKAHVKSRHSIELLLVDILSAFQWFNPAIWMLRSDLQELHEYEADDSVLRNGGDVREYQYLLLRKAVSKSGYSVANSFNHSILKNRFTMMSKSKSPQSRGLKALYVLPLVCLCIGLQAKTVNEPIDKKDDIAKEEYGDRAGDSVVFVHRTMPKFQGNGGGGYFAHWLKGRITRPEGCNQAGTMVVSFVVDVDGSVKDVKVQSSICEELDNLVVSLIEQSPKWEPATANGEPDSQWMAIPIYL